MAESNLERCPGNYPFCLGMVDFDCCGTQGLAGIEASYIPETLVHILVIARALGSASGLGYNQDIVLAPGYNYNFSYSYVKYSPKVP